MPNGLALRRFEGLFGRNAIEPTLLRELFVVGKTETDENTHFAASLFICAAIALVGAVINWAVVPQPHPRAG